MKCRYDNSFKNLLSAIISYVLFFLFDLIVIKKRNKKQTDFKGSANWIRNPIKERMESSLQCFSLIKRVFMDHQAHRFINIRLSIHNFVNYKIVVYRE